MSACLCPNVEFMMCTGQVHTTTLIGCSNFCHATFDCSSGSGITSIIHSLASHSSYLQDRFKKTNLFRSYHGLFCCVTFDCSSGIFFIISTRSFCRSPFQSLFTSCSSVFPHIYVQPHDPVFLFLSYEVLRSNICPERLVIVRLWLNAVDV